jgi:hypothetical protein
VNRVDLSCLRRDRKPAIVAGRPALTPRKP